MSHCMLVTALYHPPQHEIIVLLFVEYVMAKKLFCRAILINIDICFEGREAVDIFVASYKSYIYRNIVFFPISSHYFEVSRV